MDAVKLDPIELAACRMMGNLRSHASRINGSKVSFYNGNDPLDTDEDGFIGEYAFCKANNLFFDITAKPRLGGYDCIYKGQRIDVKTTRWTHGKLMVKDINNTDIDVYVLVILEDNTIRFPGYCTINRLKEEGARLLNSDGSYRYEMTQDKLSPWK